ncbi:MAG: M48 family metallopeptidase [Phreatobacter sp.]|nr:M48 family metallopeptidase [Phreatobacter sp.]
MPSVAAIYYDGIVSLRHAVEVSLHPEGLAIFSAEGAVIATWPYAAIRRIEGFRGAGLAVTRQQDPGSTTEPRLEIADPAFAAELAARAPLTLTGSAASSKERRSVVVWAIAAVISLLGLAYFGLPAIAGRIAPLVPASVEMRLGASMDPQIRREFGGPGGMKTCSAPAGVAALNELVSRYEQHANLHVPLRVVVIDHSMVNAFALPGGYVYIMRGLIARARGPDEVAGVLGHEIGHVRYRHGLQSAIQSGGLGFLLGTVFGDFAGGTAILLASRTLLSSAFSREAEREADTFGVDLMLKAGGNPEGLAGFFRSAGGGGPPGALSWITSHPASAEREEAIRRMARDRPIVAPALSPAQWQALREICQTTS